MTISLLRERESLSKYQITRFVLSLAFVGEGLCFEIDTNMNCVGALDKNLVKLRFI